MKKYFFHFLAMSMAMVLMLSGCIEEYEADITAEDSDLLVVEGAICSGTLNKFYLSRTQALRSSSTPRMVTGATVLVRGSDGSEYKAQAADGYYACQIEALEPDVAYYLHIETDGEVYESDPLKPLRTEEIADVVGVQNTPESNIDVLVTPAEPFAPDKVNYYSWTYDETWEVHPQYTTYLYYDTQKMSPVVKVGLFPSRGWKDATGSTIMVGTSQNYEGQHIRSLKLYDIDRGSERMYYKYSTLVRQRAITKAEYNYELARRQASSEMGGLFTPLPSALPSNIHCLTSRKHVIGFVGCTLNSTEYRVFFKAMDYSIARPPYNDTRRWIENPSSSTCCKLVEEGMYLCEWDADEMTPEGDPLIRTAWAYDYQLDVRLRGAYAEEPDFWENDN